MKLYCLPPYYLYNTLQILLVKTKNINPHRLLLMYNKNHEVSQKIFAKYQSSNDLNMYSALSRH